MKWVNIQNRTENSGELVGKPGEVLSSQCWPIKTTCEHGIEISFGARNFKDECVTPKRPEMAVMAHYDGMSQSLLTLYPTLKKLLHPGHCLIIEYFKAIIRYPSKNLYHNLFLDIDWNKGKPLKNKNAKSDIFMVSF